MVSSFTVKRLVQAGALGLGFALAPVAWANDNVQLTPGEMRLAALNAMADGYSNAALTMAKSLLRRDKNDIDALLIASKAARNLGQNSAAEDYGKQAWALAGNGALKYTSAMVVAQALSSSGKRTQAQLWLRRATHIAPDDATRNNAIRDFRYVRARNPLSAELNFSVTPTNNINNGSARETTKLFGLPFDFELSGAAQALEGWEYSAGIAGRYRFDQGQYHAHDVVFQGSHRTYTLSSDAKAQAPGVSGSDFAFSQVAVGYTFHRTPENGTGPYRLNATLGQSWYAAEPYLSYLRLGGQKSFEFGDNAVLHVSGYAERQFGHATDDGDRLGADIRLQRLLGELGTIGVSFGTTSGFSDADTGEFSELRAGVDFRLAKPVLGTSVSFGLDFRERDFERSQYDPAGRNDIEVTARIDVTFNQIDAYGFNPTMTLMSRQTESTINLFDTEQLGLRLGVKSAF